MHYFYLVRQIVYILEARKKKSVNFESTTIKIIWRGGGVPQLYLTVHLNIVNIYFIPALYWIYLFTFFHINAEIAIHIHFYTIEKYLLKVRHKKPSFLRSHARYVLVLAHLLPIERNLMFENSIQYI